MSTYALNPADLRVESFEVGTLAPQAPAGATYPDCPTATGCTCYDWCLSIVGTCTSHAA